MPFLKQRGLDYRAVQTRGLRFSDTEGYRRAISSKAAINSSPQEKKENMWKRLRVGYERRFLGH